MGHLEEMIVASNYNKVKLKEPLLKVNLQADLIPSFESKGMNLGLERMQNALHKMGNPCKKIPAIQVAGTNGKGSIASFIESCLCN